MFEYLLLFLYVLVYIGPLLFTGFVAVSATQSGSYLKRTTKSELVFLAPVSMIVFVVTFFVWIVCLGIAVNTPHLFSLDWQGILSRPGASDSLGALGLLIAGFYWIIIRWYRRRCPLTLDLERRRYRTIDAYSINLKTHTGYWEDIAGIYMHRASAKGSVTYYVRLKWKGPKKLAGLLGGFSKPEKAQAFAEKMSKELGLPMVVAPMLQR